MNTTQTTPLDIQKLYRVRHFVRLVLALAVAASVAANVLHAQPNIVGRAIAAWSPLALLLTVELISRVPVHRPALTAARMSATATIAGIAAWVSYGHMTSVALRHGENWSSAHLLPLSVDGLVVVASVSLVEISARLRAATEAAETVETAEVVTVVDVAAAATVAQPVSAEPVHVEPVAVEDVEPVPAPVRRAKGRPTGRTTYKTKVLQLAAAHPDWTVAQIAKRAGCGERTVRRYLAGTSDQPRNETRDEPGTEPGALAA